MHRTNAHISNGGAPSSSFQPPTIKKKTMRNSWHFHSHCVCTSARHVICLFFILWTTFGFPFLFIYIFIVVYFIIYFFAARRHTWCTVCISIRIHIFVGQTWRRRTHIQFEFVAHFVIIILFINFAHAFENAIRGSWKTFLSQEKERKKIKCTRECVAHAISVAHCNLGNAFGCVCKIPAPSSNTQFSGRIETFFISVSSFSRCMVSLSLQKALRISLACEIPMERHGAYPDADNVSIQMVSVVIKISFMLTIVFRLHLVTCILVRPYTFSTVVDDAQHFLNCLIEFTHCAPFNNERHCSSCQHAVFNVHVHGGP